VDWLASAGVTIWQILPLTPNGQYDSPYFSFTAFGCSPWLIDLAELQQAGLLRDPRLHDEPQDAPVAFDMLRVTKEPQLLAAARTFLRQPDHAWAAGFDEFCDKQAAWLDDTSHFMAIRQHRHEPWWRWPEGLRARDPEALAQSREELADRTDVWRAVFFFAERQWSAVKDYAHERGIRLLGDLPIYVTHDSADVWLHQDEFALDSAGNLLVQSGVPPDYFSSTGQLWGNPLYRWDVMRRNDYSWWMSRLRRCAELTDIVRIDHFRALSAYWEVAGGAENAIRGKWQPGPGQHFFDILAEEIPAMPFIAEDLGTLDDDVYRLRDENELYGMRILEFGFDGNPDNPHLPANHVTHCIAYTGTHDNEPIAGWWSRLDHDTRDRVAAAWGIESTDAPVVAAARAVEVTLHSTADVAVIPTQDIAGLGDDHRMNDPGTFVGNWSWRMPNGVLGSEQAGWLRDLSSRSGRSGVTS
jgi:4-alpha-glucanotransferase